MVNCTWFSVFSHDMFEHKNWKTSCILVYFTHENVYIPVHAYVHCVQIWCGKQNLQQFLVYVSIHFICTTPILFFELLVLSLFLFTLLQRRFAVDLVNKIINHCQTELICVLVVRISQVWEFNQSVTIARLWENLLLSSYN